MTKLATPLLIALLGFADASAQTAPAPAAKTPVPAINVTLKQQIVRQSVVDGKTVEKLVDEGGTNKPLPGQTMQYTITAKNTTSGLLKGTRISLPVPGATSYVSQSCDVPSTKATYSNTAQTLDKSGRVNTSVMKFGAAPLNKTVTVTENGKSVTKTVEVNPSEYTAVNWEFGDLKAGATLSCQMRVKVK